ncbi:unnamed protein product, partial [Urochloa humidicola]
SCRHWQVTGLPCPHAIAFIGSRRFNLEDFVDEYYSVEKFKAAYSSSVCPMTDKSEWEKVDMGFKLWPPLLKKAAGRPRIRRIVGVEEGGSSSKGRRACKRCGQLGHMQKTCNETVFDPDAPPAAGPNKKRRYKPKIVEIIEEPVDAPAKKKKKVKAKTKAKPDSTKVSNQLSPTKSALVPVMTSS